MMPRRLQTLQHILLVKWHHTAHNPQPTSASYYMSILHQIDIYLQYHYHHHNIDLIYIVETPNNTTRLDNIGWLKREKIATWAK